MNKLIYSTKITGKINPQQHIHTNFILILTKTVKLNKVFSAENKMASKDEFFN